ncbi:MAG: YdcF family protein [Tahibacter sp.]
MPASIEPVPLNGIREQNPMDGLAHFRRGPWRALRDRDVWHSLTVAAIALMASGGLLYVAWLFYVLRVAARAPTEPLRARCLLLLGKSLGRDGVDADYAQRIARLHDLLLARPDCRALLLGGDSGAGDEAQAALARLRALGLPVEIRIDIENASIDTLENLRNARALLGSAAQQPVALVSSRYHLARSRLLARSLGFDAEVCAAEPRLAIGARHLARIALEAGYCLWIDIGLRWSRLIGNRRMLERIS